MKAPGSPSSALQTTYFTSSGASRVKRHFLAVSKPAPPRPRRPEAAIVATTSSGSSSPSTRASAA